MMVHGVLLNFRVRKVVGNTHIVDFEIRFAIL